MFLILAFFAAFTILCNLVVIFDLSFYHLLNLSIIALIFLPLLVYKRKSYFPPNLEVRLANCDNKIVQYLFYTAIILCFLITIFSGRFEPDEAFYSNVEIFALQNPHQVLFKYDGMFKEEGVEILHQSYRFQSYQALSAVISAITNIKAPLVRHLFFPIIATTLFIIYWSRLFNLFAPNKWQLAFVIFFILLLLSDGYHNITNYSITRFYDGKCVVANILIPSFLYYSILYFRLRHKNYLYYLAIIQVAAVGFSSSALFLMPLQVAIIFLIYSRDINNIKQNIYYLLTALYPIIIALIIKILIKDQTLANSVLFSFKFNWDFYLSQEFRNIFSILAGDLFRIIFVLLAIFTCFLFYKKDSDLRRILLWLPIIVFAVVLNPLLLELFINLFGKYVYWRLLFLLPVSLFSTLFILNIFNKELLLKIWQKDLSQFILIFFGLFLLANIYISHGYFSDKYSWKLSNITKPKFEEKSYEIAKIIVKNAPINKRALVTIPVSQFVAVNYDAPKLIAINHARRDYVSYLMILRDYFRQDDLESRKSLHDIISGKVIDFDDKQFIKNILKLEVGIAVFRSDLDNSNKLENIFKNLGFREIKITDSEYKIYSQIPK